MGKRTVVIIAIILLFIVILLLVLFNSYLKDEDENLVQNVTTNTNSSDIETNVNSNHEIDNNLETTSEEINNENNEGGEEEMKLNIRIGNENFTATLYDNETSRELLNKLPLTITLGELHGNENIIILMKACLQIVKKWEILILVI